MSTFSDLLHCTVDHASILMACNQAQRLVGSVEEVKALHGHLVALEVQLSRRVRLTPYALLCSSCPVNCCCAAQ